MAREALSNGDKILSESYLQHADHFLRISEKKINNEKEIQSNSEKNISNLNKENNETENEISEKNNPDTNEN